MTSVELVMTLDNEHDSLERLRVAATLLNVAPEAIRGLRIRKRSLDARSRAVKVRLQTEVYLTREPPAEQPMLPRYQSADGAKQVVIVGCGPAGMFAALALLEAGIRPVILERGKDVQARRRDLAAINQKGVVDPNSNYCFGEGGAGTYSDGKLYTRATKRGDIEGVLRTLVGHGAAADILIEAHPHIGSNRLPKVVQAMRQSILDAGGAIHFETRVVEMIMESSGSGRVARGVVTHDGREILGAAVILATGHSARDVFEMCLRQNVLLEAKAFAMGVRVEHPQPLIDKLQYHCDTRDPRLPAASYRLASTVEGRGVFSFCMCPGGWIVPSATAPDEVVVNGMSLSRRDSPYANSGIVVGVELEDLSQFSQHGVLAGTNYQKFVEQMACQAGGGQQRAPAQRVSDFIAGRISASLPGTSYQPGLTSAPLHQLLPAALGGRLRQGFKNFGKAMPGYLHPDAVILGVESRTSSPVRVPRDAATLQHVEVALLYPCGEGAGYAGGIVSAAMDGVRVANACVAALTAHS